MEAPQLLAMLSHQPPIEGDYALLKLAQIRLGEAGLGGELYPGNTEHLYSLLDYRPEGIPCTAHLPRDINLLDQTGQAALLEYARIATGKLYGLVLHDQWEFVHFPERTITALREIDQLLDDLSHPPRVFVEYAVGLEPDFFATLFEESGELMHVSAGIDVGHVGIHVCRSAYRNEHPGAEVCDLRPDSPDLAANIDAVQQAVAHALPAVLTLIDRLVRLGRPLHFHLHDGHPLSTFSQFGVSDHLSFLQQIRLPFKYQGRYLLQGIFGLSGLRDIVQTALQGLPPGKLSFLIEVHPMEGRTPLAEQASLFSHWQNKTNAERMNYWLDLMFYNAEIVRGVWERGERRALF